MPNNRIYFLRIVTMISWAGATSPFISFLALLILAHTSSPSKHESVCGFHEPLEPTLFTFLASQRCRCSLQEQFLTNYWWELVDNSSQISVGNTRCFYKWWGLDWFMHRRAYPRVSDLVDLGWDWEPAFLKAAKWWRFCWSRHHTLRTTRMYVP